MVLGSFRAGSGGRKLYSGGPHTRFHKLWEGSLRILGSGTPLRRNPPSGALNSTLPGPREWPSILNVHPVVVAAAVFQRMALKRALRPIQIDLK